jgi:hypothetical protein
LSIVALISDNLPGPMQFVYSLLSQIEEEIQDLRSVKIEKVKKKHKRVGTAHGIIFDLLIDAASNFSDSAVLESNLLVQKDKPPVTFEPVNFIALQKKGVNRFLIPVTSCSPSRIWAYFVDTAKKRITQISLSNKSGHAVPELRLIQKHFRSYYGGRWFVQYRWKSMFYDNWICGDDGVFIVFHAINWLKHLPPNTVTFKGSLDFRFHLANRLESTALMV